MPLDNRIDQLIEDCINHLGGDEIENGAKSLLLLAKEFANCGMTQRSFIDMRVYIIESAKKITSDESIYDKVKSSEQSLMAQRTGQIIIH